jgi:hypothetical protein
MTSIFSSTYSISGLSSAGEWGVMSLWVIVSPGVVSERGSLLMPPHLVFRHV